MIDMNLSLAAGEVETRSDEGEAIGSPRYICWTRRTGSGLRMHRPPHLVRRTALGMLTTWPLSMTNRRASAAVPAVRQASAMSPAEARQAEALAQAEFTDPQGSPHRLGELTRPLVLVNLWAAWCSGCLEELPTMRTLASLLGPDAIDIVLLSHEMNWRGDQAYAREKGLPFRHWRLAVQAPDRVTAAAFRIEADRFALPQSLVFAGRGRALLHSQEGSQDWATPARVRLARAWLAAAE